MEEGRSCSSREIACSLFHVSSGDRTGDPKLSPVPYAVNPFFGEKNQQCPCRGTQRRVNGIEWQPARCRCVVQLPWTKTSARIDA